LIVGPVEIVVVGFEDDADLTEIEQELERLRESEVIRLVDVMVVRHKEHGVIEMRQLSDLAPDEALAFGAAVGTLIGLGMGGEASMEAGAVWGMRELADGHVFDETDGWAIAERVPEGRAAVVALLEHRWRTPVRDAVGRAGGALLAAGWVREEHLIGLGRLAALPEGDASA
jgi:uncharacterized membrane protein